MKKISKQQKYDLYEEAVQSPEGEVEILLDAYQKIRKKKPIILREDFCGSSALSAAWVRADPKNISYGVDLDLAPLSYAFENHVEKLDHLQKKRIKLLHDNVLTAVTPLADIVAALNFSYFIFKERQQLKEYFISAFKHLKKDGVFFIDLFGGFEAQKVLEEKTDRGKFYYYWDCLSFNPINHHVKFAIHFKLKKKKSPKIENVFEYDWRLWSMPELKDLLVEAGFKNVHCLWEGDDSKGGGNGDFFISTKEDNCESWVAYLAACK